MLAIPAWPRAISVPWFVPPKFTERIRYGWVGVFGARLAETDDMAGSWVIFYHHFTIVLPSLILGAFLKNRGRPPVLMHFRFGFSQKPTSYWGTPIYGNPQVTSTSSVVHRCCGAAPELADPGQEAPENQTRPQGRPPKTEGGRPKKCRAIDSWEFGWHFSDMLDICVEILLGSGDSLQG